MIMSARWSPPRYSSRSGNPVMMGMPAGSNDEAASAWSCMYWSYISLRDTNPRVWPAPLTAKSASSASRMVASMSSVSLYPSAVILDPASMSRLILEVRETAWA